MEHSIIQIEGAEIISTPTVPDHCVWYGQCGHSILNYQNCPYNGTAQPLVPAGVTILRKWCPHFFDGPFYDDKGIRTCCDLAQLRSLDANMPLAATFLKRCPSCFSNFARSICEMSCGPQQSRFLEIVEVKYSNESKIAYTCSHSLA